MAAHLVCNVLDDFVLSLVTELDGIVLLWKRKKTNETYGWHCVGVHTYTERERYICSNRGDKLCSNFTPQWLMRSCYTYISYPCMTYTQPIFCL